MLVLGIETSCDETACAVVEDGLKIHANVVASSLKEHRPYGGVIPEIACRSHVESILPVVDQTLREAGVGFRDLGLLAATEGPGLVGALLVGMTVAKTLSFSQQIPFVGVDHIQAHLYACLMQEPAPDFPFLGLVVSGGHTNLYEVSDYDQFHLIGQTRDDACGEAFDKVAKILGLGYPGGPVIEQRSRGGNPHAFSFPTPQLKDHPFDFSFSGLKTAVLYKVRELTLSSSVIDDLCASFQRVVIEGLVERSLQTCRRLGLRALVVGGGVTANQALRAAFEGRFRQEALEVYFPPRGLSLDNAAMVAGLGYQLYRKGIHSSLDLACSPLGKGVDR